MVINEIIVGEKLIRIEWLMVLNFQDRWGGLEFFFFLHQILAWHWERHVVLRGLSSMPPTLLIGREQEIVV